MTEKAPRGRGPGRLLRSGALALLTALLALVAPVVLPASASAAGYYGGYDGYNGGYNDGGYNGGYYDGGYNGGYSGGSTGGYTGAVVVTPVLNCVLAGTNGAYTAVLGYRNTSSSTYTITGDYNVISPSSYNGQQPTVFKPGTYSGVFRVTVSSGTLYWTLGNSKLTISRTSTPACPKDTQMPADGNGTGVVGALAVAAGVGALMVRRARRRADALTPHQEPVDA
jgi:hypothetical protein